MVNRLLYPSAQAAEGRSCTWMEQETKRGIKDGATLHSIGKNACGLITMSQSPTLPWKISTYAESAFVQYRHAPRWRCWTGSWGEWKECGLTGEECNQKKQQRQEEIILMIWMNVLPHFFLNTTWTYVKFDSWLPMKYSDSKIKNLIVNGIACAKYHSYMYALTTHTKHCILKWP